MTQQERQPAIRIVELVENMLQDPASRSAALQAGSSSSSSSSDGGGGGGGGGIQTFSGCSTPALALTAAGSSSSSSSSENLLQSVIQARLPMSTPTSSPKQ